MQFENSKKTERKITHNFTDSDNCFTN